MTKAIFIRFATRESNSSESAATWDAAEDFGKAFCIPLIRVLEAKKISLVQWGTIIANA
jgi:hypothetical protein